MDPRELDKMARLHGFTDKPRPKQRVNPQASKIRKLLVRLAAYKAEGLALYQPLSVGVYFHRNVAKYRVADGTVRSGKTQAAAAETSRALLGCDPHDKFVRRNGNALIAGSNRWTKLSVAAMCMAVGKVSFEDWERLTWSLGWMGCWLPSVPPSISIARLAMTSLTFIFVWVPLPVCQTRRGK